MLVWGAANHDDRPRLEARVAFEEWHSRVPEYELDGTPRGITSTWARAFGEVPVHIP
jgi:hypothetical protein